jgi:hypothetical protein
VRPHFQTVRVRAVVSTAEPLEKLAAVIEETEARCQVMNLLLDAKVDLRVPLMRIAGGVVAAGIIGGAVLYVIMRWGLLPSANPLMAFVPQIAFFLAHLLFGLVVGVVLAVAFRRGGMLGTQAQAGR